MEKNQIFINGLIAGILVGFIIGSALCSLIVNSN